jgi:hypothetical protein
MKFKRNDIVEFTPHIKNRFLRAFEIDDSYPMIVTHVNGSERKGYLYNIRTTTVSGKMKTVVISGYELKYNTTAMRVKKIKKLLNL